jgi:hypothetical protein
MDDSARPEEDGFKALPVVGGMIVGFIVTWILFFVTLLVVYANYGDSTGTTQDVIAFSGLLGPPIVFGLLLIPRRTRHFGAGLLLGLAIGSITAAGICGGFFGLNAM